MPCDSHEILGEGRRNCAEGGCADHDELRPAEEKSSETAPGFSHIDVDSACLRKRARCLRKRKRTAQGEYSTDDPDREQRKRTRKLGRNASRRSENSGSNR